MVVAKFWLRLHRAKPMNASIAGLLVILAISSLSGWWLAGRKSQEKPVRVMIFVGYFWLLTFCQLLLAVLVHLGWQRFLNH